MKTTNAGEDTNQATKGLIIEVVGAGWRHLGGDLWESPGGETYVGIDLAKPEPEIKPPAYGLGNAGGDE